MSDTNTVDNGNTKEIPTINITRKDIGKQISLPVGKESVIVIKQDTLKLSR